MELQMNNGWIKLFRRLRDNPIWQKKPAEWLKIWLYILLEVNYINSKLPTGSGFFRKPWEKIADESSSAHITRDQWDGCIRWLRRCKMIVTSKTTRGSIIRVLKYSNYQSDGQSQNDSENETETKQKRNRNDTISKELLRTIKNDKKSTTILSQINNLISQFPSNLQSLINEYIDIARLQNKTEKISLYRQKRLIDELLLLWNNYKGHPIDEADYRNALKITVNNHAPNVNYVRKVIKNIVNKRSTRIKGVK